MSLTDEDLGKIKKVVAEAQNGAIKRLERKVDKVCAIVETHNENLIRLDEQDLPPRVHALEDDITNIKILTIKLAALVGIIVSGLEYALPAILNYLRGM